MLTAERPRPKAEPRLAIVGASVRAAAESAVRGGFEVVAADLFADADLRAICPTTKIEDYPHGLRDWLAAQDVDAWMYTGALENHPELVDELAAIRPLLGVSGDALRRARDPIHLQGVFQEAGVAFPETRTAAQPPPEGGGWLAKSYAHSAGAGVERLTTSSSLPFVQRFVEGQPMSAVYAVGSGGATLVGMTAQLVGEAGAGSWAYCGSIGPITPTTPQQARLERIGDALRSSLGLVGVIGVDLIAGGDELSAIEINPRYPASAEVLEKAVGRSVVGDHVRACRGESIDPWPSVASTIVGKRILYASSDTRVTGEFVEWLASEGHADRPQPDEAIAAGRPVCTLLVEDDDVDAVREGLRRLAVLASRRLGDLELD